MQLNNYKSYLKSETLKLFPGVNVVVGRNHAGKTALLEGLSLGFPNKTYRSSRIRRRAGSQEDNVSSAIVSFTVSHKELWEILSNLPREFTIPVPSKEKLNAPKQMQEHEQESSFLEDVFKLEQFTFQARFKPVREDRDNRRISHVQFPAWGMYEADGYPDKSAHAIGQINDDGKFVVRSVQKLELGYDFGLEVAELLSNRIYNFRAERFATASVLIGNSTRLAPDASNLAEVLENLQGQSPSKFRLLNIYLRDIFPQIYEALVRHDPGNAQHREVIVYEEESLNAEDAIPLRDSGAGVGQVLAMLYVLVSSEYPQTIIIDEPQNFLHPGAVRKLFEIFNVHSQHQYIIATHLPNVIAAADPSQIILVRKPRGQESTLRVIDKDDTEELRLTLHEVGARLGDVFGADYVLWVEGATERDCFPSILQALRPKRLRGTEFAPVLSPDEVLVKEADRVIRIYERLSQGRNLLPPATGFLFDRECRSDDEIADLERRVGRTVKFIKRRMYENYLLKPMAIEAVLLGAGLSQDVVSASEIERWLEQEIVKPDYYCPKLLNREPWIKHIDGSKFLYNLFSYFSETKLSYEDKKVEYGVKLTRWLLENDSSDLVEIADLIYGLLPEEG